jgi:hypothetical protein
MKNALTLAFALAIAATPALAQKITIDYAHDFDFSSLETYEYVNTKDTNPSNELTGNRIKNAIIRELSEGGLRSVSSDPDLFVTYHLTSQENTVLNTTSFGYGGAHRGWRGWGGGMGTSTTTASTYTEGTLIVDAYAPDENGEKKMVWRGTGTVTVKSKPEKQQKQIDKILDKLGKRWKKILEGKGK